MPTRSRAAKATTECSHCHVAAGADCVDGQGRPLDTIHAARMRAYGATAKRGRPAKAPTRTVPVRVLVTEWDAFLERHGTGAAEALRKFIRGR